ncbi:MAG: hypothetical protein HN380_13055, partial [Victivallales bacterium]|nr:hypothetical protein [Victivallales bacterium]
MSNLRRLSLVLAVSVLFNVGLTALWLRARRAAILPSVAKVTLREEKTESPTVDVQFTTDMPTGKVDPSNPPVLFTPPVAGKSTYTWQSPRLLAVSLDDSVLTPGKTYQTRARDGLQDARGLVVDARARPFVSPALRLTGPIEVERVSENSTRLVLPLNGLVFPRNLASKTTLSYMWQDKPATSTTSTVQAEYAHRAILMVNHPPGLKKATVRIAAKLKAKDADIGTLEEIEQEIKLVPHLRFTRAWCPSRNSRELSIRFSTTTRLKQEGLSERIEISPPARVSIATGYRGLTLSGGDLKPRTFYRITFRKGIQGLLSTVLEEDTTFTVITGRFSPSLEFLSSGPLLPRSRKAELLARLSSVEEATFTAWRVYPRNYVEYFTRDWYSRYSSGRHASYGTQLRSVTFKPQMEGGKQEVRTVPLDELLQGQTTGLFVIEGKTGDNDKRNRRRVILTDIGLGVVQDRDSILVWALSLADGTPLANCQIDIYTDKNLPIGSARTGRNGTALITHGKLPKGEAPYLVTARLGDDASMLLLDGSGDHNQVPFALKGRPYPKHAYEAFVYTERGICRPGERIIAAALVRDDGRLRSAADLPVELRVRDPLGRVLRRIPRTLNADGFATARFEIPFDARTGGYSIQVAMPGDGPVWGETRFTVGCYRPDQIRTTFELDKPQYEIPKEKITATLDGRFYFGPPASDCQANFRWEFTQRPFRPKGYEDYTFGDEQRGALRSAGDRVKAKTDEKGRAQLVFLPKPKGLPAAAWGIGLTAELIAPSGATVSARQNATLHVYPFYLGIKRLWKREEPPKGNILRFSWAAVSPAGKEVAPGEKVSCELHRHEYIYTLRERSHGFVREWAERWVPVAKGEVPNSTTGARGTFTVPAPRAGSYRLTITGRDNVSASTRFWYSAGDAEFARPASPTALLLETDKPAYAPGETAMVSFHSPVAGQALLCLSGKTALRTVPIAVQAGRNVVPLPLPATVPYASLFVSATVVCRFKDGHDATRRLFGLGRITLVQDKRRLDVALDVAATARPNGKLPVTIRLRSGDVPSRGTVQLLAVDEGVLALTAYRTPDPFAHFFGPRSCSLTFADAYNQVFTDLSGEYGDAS